MKAYSIRTLPSEINKEKEGKSIDQRGLKHAEPSFPPQWTFRLVFLFPPFFIVIATRRSRQGPNPVLLDTANKRQRGNLGRTVVRVKVRVRVLAFLEISPEEEEFLTEVEEGLGVFAETR